MQLVRQYDIFIGSPNFRKIGIQKKPNDIGIEKNKVIFISKTQEADAGDTPNITHSVKKNQIK